MPPEKTKTGEDYAPESSDHSALAGNPQEDSEAGGYPGGSSPGKFQGPQMRVLDNTPDRLPWHAAFIRPFSVENADKIPFYDDTSHESHFFYINTYLQANYTILGTVFTIYIVVMSQVLNMLDKEGEGDGIRLVDLLKFVYLVGYPLFAMLSVIIVCLETVAREYLFYAYFRNRVLLDLEDANDKMFPTLRKAKPGAESLWSRLHWDYVFKPSYGYFPHIIIISTIILGLCTGGWVTSVCVVAGQSINLLFFYNHIIKLKSRLLSVSQFMTGVIADAVQREMVPEGSEILAEFAGESIQVALKKLRHAEIKERLAVEVAGANFQRCFISEEADLSKETGDPELKKKLLTAWSLHSAATQKGVNEAVAILRTFTCVTEQAARDDASFLAHERKRVHAALMKQRKLAGERQTGLFKSLSSCVGCASDETDVELKEALAPFRISFGEKDPLTGRPYPILGLMGKTPAPKNLTGVFVNVMYLGLFSKLWVLLTGLRRNPSFYYGNSASAHAVFSARLNYLLYVGFFLVGAVELYGAYKAGIAFAGRNSCDRQLLNQCAATPCLSAMATAYNFTCQHPK